MEQLVSNLRDEIQNNCYYQNRDIKIVESDLNIQSERDAIITAVSNIRSRAERDSKNIISYCDEILKQIS